MSGVTDLQCASLQTATLMRPPPPHTWRTRTVHKPLPGVTAAAWGRGRQQHRQESRQGWPLLLLLLLVLLLLLPIRRRGVLLGRRTGRSHTQVPQLARQGQQGKPDGGMRERLMFSHPNHSTLLMLLSHAPSTPCLQHLQP